MILKFFRRRAERRGNWVTQYTGTPYWPLDPREEDIHLMNVAHSLSNLCRFGGHCIDFYSVAEHSVLVSEALQAQGHSVDVQMQGLLHDASESVMVDMPKPLKVMLALYVRLENRNWKVFARRFGLPEQLHPAVHEMDTCVCLAEKEQILNKPTLPWKYGVGMTPANVTIRCLPPKQAKDLFLARYAELAYLCSVTEKAA